MISNFKFKYLTHKIFIHEFNNLVNSITCIGFDTFKILNYMFFILFVLFNILSLNVIFKKCKMYDSSI